MNMVYYPEHRIVAGSTIYAPLVLQDGVIGASAKITIANYFGAGDDAFIQQTVTIQDILGRPSIYLRLTANETSELCGKYIYQVTFSKVDGSVVIGRGFITVYYNIELGSSNGGSGGDIGDVIDQEQAISAYAEYLLADLQDKTLA